MATEQDIANGLFDWVNSLQVSEPVSSPAELSDGAVIWKILKHIDGLCFPGSLPEIRETGQWAHKWTNLKHIYDALSIFLLEECGQQLPLSRGKTDLKAIALSSSLSDTISLLKLVVVAAINCNDRIRYLQRMQILSEKTQEVLMGTAQEAGEYAATHSETASEPSEDPENLANVSYDLDTDLASEERLGKVIADNQRLAHDKRDLQSQLDDFQRRVATLQADYESALGELKETNKRLTAVLAGTTDVGLNKANDQKQQNIIASLEARLLSADANNDDLRKANEVLKIKTEKVQRLQDDLDEIKGDRDKLARKANTAEKYKQKLESLQDVERENQSLRSHVAEVQNQLKQSDISRLSSTDLLREIEEYKRLLPSIEQERYELSEMKKRLEFDYHTLEARYQDVMEQHFQQRKNLEDSQSRLREYEDGIVPSTSKPNNPQDEALLEYESGANESTSPEVSSARAGHSSDLISDDELRVILSAIRAQARPQTEAAQRTIQHLEQKLVETIQSNHGKHLSPMGATQSNSSPSNLVVSDNAKNPLPEYFTSPTRASYDNRLVEALDHNQILHRELRLMTAAWYEQNSRFSSHIGTFSRNRSSAEPQSLLGRQRKIVEAMMLGKAST